MVEINLKTSGITEEEKKIYRNRLQSIARQSRLDADIEVDIVKNDRKYLAHLRVRLVRIHNRIDTPDDFRRYREMARHLCDALEETARQCFATMYRK